MTTAVLDIQDAISLLEQRESRKAAHVLEQIVAEMPAYATARVLLARSYEALGDSDLALAVWQEALQLVPNSPVVRQGVERTIARSGSAPHAEDAESEATAEIPVTAPRPQDASPATDRRPSDVPRPAELRAQDVPPPTHQPPRPRHETRAPHSTAPRVGAAKPPPPGERTEPPRQGERTEPPRQEERAEPPRQQERPDPPRPTDTAPKSDSGGGSEPRDDLADLRDVRDTGTPHYEDLDRLISELESARIVPRPDLESVPSPDLEDDIEDVVSETLARIYASQGQYDEAARVYELLAGQHPEDADDYLQKASYMRSRASDGP